MGLKHLALAVWAVSGFQPGMEGGQKREVRAMSKKKASRERPKGAGRVAQGKRRGALIQGILEEKRVVHGMDPSADPLLGMVECIVKAADMRKASDTAAFYVKPATDIASFVVVTNGRSRPQNDAIAAAVVDDVEEFFQRTPQHVEGGADGGWTLIDFGDVIVNVMTPLSREYYDIDAIWRPKVPTLDLAHLITPNSDLVDDADLLAEYFVPPADGADDEWATWLDDNDNPADVLAQAKRFLDEADD